MKQPLTQVEVETLYRDLLPNLPQRGKEWRGPCPLHSGKNPSFAVSSETGAWTCFSKCGRGGSAVDLYMAMTGKDFKTAVVEIEGIVGRVTSPKNSKSKIAAGYNYTDETGKLAYQVVRLEPKEFRQRRPDGTGGFIWNMKDIRRVLYRLPRVMAAAEVLVVEGEKDVHTAEGLGYTATCNSGGAGKWRPEFGDALAGKLVVVFPDNDEAGRKHAEDVVRSVRDKASEIRVVKIPVGKDVTDWISAGATKETINAAIATAPVVCDEKDQPVGSSMSNSGDSKPLPEIYANSRQLRDFRAEGLAAMVQANTPPRTFVRGNSLVDIRSTDDGRYIINNLTDVQLRGHLSDVASFYVETETGRQSCPPPLYLAKDILGHRDAVNRFPGLVGITEIPVLRPDGTVLVQAGYDAATRLYYYPARDLVVPPIPELPTTDDVQRALHLIESAVGDFPFVYDLNRDLELVLPGERDHSRPEFSASMANALGLLLTPVVRTAINGPTPLAVITAPAAGSGKTLLGEIVSKIATGREAALFSAPRDEEEWRKQITSYLKEGVGVIVIDNVCGDLASGQLSKALTANMWADRILGHSQTVLLPVRCTWIANGNDIVIGGDLPRRCYLIKFDAKTARPHLRSGFRHPNLRRWVSENRGHLIGALLTLARAWFAAGKPQLNQIVLGSYESWAEVIGGILGHVGVPGFLGNSGEFQDQTEAAAEAEGKAETKFLQALHDAAGGNRFTSADVHRFCRHEPTARPLTATLPPQLSEVLGVDGDFERRLGRWLAERADGRFGDGSIHVKRVGMMHKTQLWQVVDPRPVESAVIQ